MLVFVGCFAGAAAESALSFPELGTAILFAPYAILTAALLVSPSRYAWTYFLAAALGDFIPHRQLGGPIGFVLLTEAANFARALVAAVAIRRFGDGGRFRTLRGMMFFLLFAVVLAPMVGAFLGATIVELHGTTQEFGLVWQAWFSSNMLTGLTLLPILLVSVHDFRLWPRRVPPARLAEGAALSLGVLAVGAIVLLGQTANHGGVSAGLYWPLPLLLWAAVRFGPRGTSAALLGITLLTIGGVLRRRGPFVGMSPAENLLHLQLFLAAISVPLLLLSALLEEQRRTAVALRQSREQYRTVVEDQTEAICRFLPDGTCTFVNGAYCSYFDLRADAIVGAVLPEVLRPSQGNLDGLTPEHPVASRETSIPGRAGELRWQTWLDRGLFDARGRIVEYQSVGRDITEHKAVEDQRRLLEAQRRAEFVLREADRHKDEFLAMLGHELRNPLATIALVLETSRLSSHDAAQSNRAHEVIARQVAQLTRLVDDLLDVSRITRDTIRLQIDDVDLADVVARAMETARPLLESRRHDIRVFVPEGLLAVRGDPVRLGQVVANILNNAAKYTEPGGHIEVSLRREKGYAKLSVRDDGIGIAPEMLPRIFDLFIQAPESRDRSQGGLGVGLTLVKRLVELHGGQVEATSPGPERGSEIVVRLPAEPLSVPEPAPPPASVPLERADAPLKILVVDDNVDVAESLAVLLGAWGHTVRTAHDGVAALEAATQLSPDAVFLDIGLPKLDGLEVARRLRRMPEQSQTLLVAMTGFGQQRDRDRTSEAGFDRHLVKPIDMQTIRSVLTSGAGPDRGVSERTRGRGAS